MPWWPASLRRHRSAGSTDRSAGAAQEAAPKGTDEELASRHVDIWSDGTRLSGDLWRSGGFAAEDKRPAIILCHGWGGLRSHLNASYAAPFARAGYVVLTFDYRGWGDSDSRLAIKGALPVPDANGEATVRVQVIRELVDPFDQTEDIVHCLDFLSGEPGVDPQRIGLWGTSFAGGHVLYVATHDPRPRCLVSQVPSMDGGWVHQNFDPRRMAIQRARGEIAPVPQGVDRIGSLQGTPFLSRIADYHPVDFAAQLSVPILIIVASRDELTDNSLHGRKVFEIVKTRVAARYEVVVGTHFDIYEQGLAESTRMAIAWFDEHL